MLNWNLLDKVIVGSKKIFLTTHANPDADGLGSELAMYYYLKSIKIDCKIINASKTPEYLHFLDPDGIIEIWDKNKHSDWIKDVDISIAFDIGNYKRMNDLSSVINSEISFIQYKFNNGNASAGTRIRKAMQTVKGQAQDLRKEVQEIKERTEEGE